MNLHLSCGLLMAAGILGCSSVSPQGPDAKIGWRALVPVKATLRELLKSADHDHDKRITDKDGANLIFVIKPTKGPPITIRGTRSVINLYGELKKADQKLLGTTLLKSDLIDKN